MREWFTTQQTYDGENWPVAHIVIYLGSDNGKSGHWVTTKDVPASDNSWLMNALGGSEGLAKTIKDFLNNYVNEQIEHAETLQLHKESE